MFSAIGLPRGVAIVRVQTPIGRVILISDRLTEDEAKFARAIACDRIRLGAKAVIVHELELMSLMLDAA